MTGIEPLVIERHGDHVLILRLNRPDRRNAINVELADLLLAAFDHYEADPELRCAVLVGQGDVFCSGFDLADVSQGRVPSLEIFSRPLTKPLIAAPDGPAVAGGFELCLRADLIVAASDVVMGVPEVRRSLVAVGGAAIFLCERLPRPIAAEMLLTGRVMPVSELHRHGLVNHVTEPGQAVPRALELAEEIAAAAPLAVSATRQIMQQARDWDTVEAWERQWEYAQVPLASEDAKEGPRAFLEKRPPAWQGR